MDIIGTALIPVAVSAATAWAVPWPKWWFEKLKLRHRRRGQLVDQWRKDLLPIAETDGAEFVTHTSFASLEPHLSDEFKRHLPRPIEWKNDDGTIRKIPANQVVVLHEGNWAPEALRKEISRLERLWKLV